MPKDYLRKYEKDGLAKSKLMISILQLAKSFQFLQFSSTSYIRPRCILHAVATTKFLVAV